jgi:predicted GIY-YIG superfamily endonuclease
VFYIGQTDRFEKRMRQHVTDSYPSRAVLAKRLCSIHQSELSTVAVILAYPESRVHALELERWFIRYYRTTVVNVAYRWR